MAARITISDLADLIWNNDELKTTVMSIVIIIFVIFFALVIFAARMRAGRLAADRRAAERSRELFFQKLQSFTQGVPSSDFSSAFFGRRGIRVEHKELNEVLALLPPLKDVEAARLDVLCVERWEEFKRCLPKAPIGQGDKFELKYVHGVVQALVLAALGEESDLKVWFDKIALDEYHSESAKPDISVTAARDAVLSIRSGLLTIEIKSPDAALKERASREVSTSNAPKSQIECAMWQAILYGLRSVGAQCREKCCVWQDPAYDASLIHALTLATDGESAMLIRVSSGAPRPGQSFEGAHPGITFLGPVIELLPKFDFTKRVPPRHGPTAGFKLLVRLLFRGVNGLSPDGAQRMPTPLQLRIAPRITPKWARLLENLPSTSARERVGTSRARQRRESQAGGGPGGGGSATAAATAAASAAVQATAAAATAAAAAAAAAAAGTAKGGEGGGGGGGGSEGEGGGGGGTGGGSAATAAGSAAAFVMNEETRHLGPNQVRFRTAPRSRFLDDAGTAGATDTRIAEGSAAGTPAGGGGRRSVTNVALTPATATVASGTNAGSSTSKTSSFSATGTVFVEAEPMGGWVFGGRNVRVEVFELLGSGGSGDVFRCRSSNGENAVLKVGRSNTLEIRDLLGVEAFVLSKLASVPPSPHLPALVGWLQWREVPENMVAVSWPMLMTQPLGEPLSAWMLTKHLEVGSVDRIKAANEVVAGVLQALRHTHSRGIAHCDVRPANVVVAGQRVVLVDWGLAQPLGKSSRLRGVESFAADYVFQQPEFIVHPSLDLVAVAFLWFSIVYSEDCTAPWGRASRAEGVRRSRWHWFKDHRKGVEGTLVRFIERFGERPTEGEVAWPLRLR